MTSFVSRPHDFKEGFRQLVAGASDVMKACAPPAPPSELAEGEAFCFQLTSKQERPVEFLQSMLDLLRVTFEPNPPGTTYLNSNWDFIYDSVPDEPFRLGYMSVVGDPGQEIDGLSIRQLKQRMSQLDYAYADAYASFVSVTVGTELFRKSLRVNGDALKAFGAGFTPSDLMGAITATAGGSAFRPPRGTVYAGTALDDGLSDQRIRASVWLFLPLRDAH